MAVQLSFALKQCGSFSVVRTKAAHSTALKTGHLSDLHFATRILSAYKSCGGIVEARQLFDEIRATSLLDVVSWNSIISGFVQSGRDEMAFQYFKRMRQYFSTSNLQDIGSPDSYTLSALLSSTYCLHKNAITAQQLHGYAIKSGVLSGSLSVGNALITLYAAWDRLHDSRVIFESLPRKNVVSWTALISGHSQQRNHEVEEALKAFVSMMREEEDHNRPNQFTFASIFSSCGRLASLSQGTQFITLAFKMGLLSHIHVQNSIVRFYSECGCLDEAKATFESIKNPDLVSWNSLLKGYSQQGQGQEALAAFQEMQTRGETPDSISFLSVLSACRHTGLISQGLELLRAMKINHGIEPQCKHISCIVDLLGRAGQLRQAEEFIKGIQFELSASVWRTLLGACRVYGKAELAELAASKLLELDHCDTEAHIVLSHIYAARGEWNMVAELRRLLKERGGSKEPGSSWIEVANRVHSFVASDWSHPLMNEIHTMLMVLIDHIKDRIFEDELVTKKL